MARNLKEQKLRMSPSSQTRTRAEQIADAIAKDIAQGRLRAGEKLSESELAEHFQVSRGPVRDALDLLERNMLVTIKPRSYTVVNQLTIRELEQVFEFRKHVLGLAAKFAARNRMEQDLDRLKACLERLMSVLETDQRDVSTQAFPASQMWDAIIDASHSHVVRQGCLHFTGGNIWSTAVEDKIQDTRLPAYQKKRIELWQETSNAIEKSNESAAYHAGQALVENNWEFLKGTFSQYFPEK
jgi:DNA-binding GntR family transcriptional regulator